MFVVAGTIQRFVRAAREIGLAVFAETALDAITDFPDGFAPAAGGTALSRTLYATMPTIDALRRLRALWSAHQRGETAPDGASPWWSLFDVMLELRTWGPEDRLSASARAIIEDRLPFDDNAQVSVELEVWPTSDVGQRTAWRRDAERRVADLGGRVLDRASISEDGFVYEGILAGLSAIAVRAMLDDPGDLDGLATLEGVQFVLPQTIAQSAPSEPVSVVAPDEPGSAFNGNAPIRAALLDGTPAAAHTMLDGGVIIEDVHDLVRLSVVDHRYHATGMASLILRGDLQADGDALNDARIVSVPVLVDGDDDTRSPEDRLFVDLVHSGLTRLLRGREPLAADVFVVNFSVGLREFHFAGRISALARLMDWWSAADGVLFVISAGNIGELLLRGVRPSEFAGADEPDRREIVDSSLRAAAYRRTLLAPAECLNGLCVGGLSRDLSGETPPTQAEIVSLEGHEQVLPQMTSAFGLGPHRAVKPDLLETGGKVEVRALPQGDNAILKPVTGFSRTGLVAAAPGGGLLGLQRLRGTSPAAALTTRAILQSAEALTGDGGPYEGQELPRRTLALLTRALAVNAARWPEDAVQLQAREQERLGSQHHARAKEEVCRRFGHGVLDTHLMRHAPDMGVTLVGYGTVRKDSAQVFSFPFPGSLSGERVPRSIRATVAWFSPIDPVRSQYRLAGLAIEAVAPDEDSKDPRWGLGMKTSGPDANMVKRGTVWSQRLVNRVQKVPYREGNEAIQLRVQCRDTSGGGLSPDTDIPYALAVTFEIEADVQYDVYQEIRDQLLVHVGVYA